EDVRLAQDPGDDPVERGDVAASILAQLLDDVLDGNPVPQGQRQGSGEDPVDLVVKDPDDILQQKLIIVADRDPEVVGRDPVHLAVLEEGPLVDLPGYLEVLRQATEDLVGPAPKETDEDDVLLTRHTGPVDVAGELLRALWSVVVYDDTSL